MTAQRRRPSGVSGYLPLAYFALALGLVAALLPSALRPPPQAPPSSGQFSPDSPPDDSQVILSELGRGSSTTAGVGAVTPAAAAGEAPAAPLVPGVRKPRKGLCFGVPPRQTFSLYSAPCAAAWSGDNGGATWPGVTRDEVRLAWQHDTHSGSYEGELPREPYPGEDGIDRTYRVLARYVNERFETYGRTVRVWLGSSASQNAPDQRRQGVKAAEEWGAFAGVFEYNRSFPACEELIRRQRPCFNAPFPRYMFLERAPYFWSWYMDTTTLRQFAAEYICKKLRGKPAKYAGDASLQASERRFGLVYQTNPPLNRVAAEFEKQLADTCGIRLAEKFGFAAGDSDTNTAGGYSEITAGITKFKAAGVTTVIPDTDLFGVFNLTYQADSQAYFPEWFVPGTAALDSNAVAPVASPNQWKRAFGVSGFELPRARLETDCFKAYSEIDPDSTPNADICRWMFPSIIQLMNGIQMAGPTLTPQTFERGLFEMGRRFYPNRWAIGGGYGTGDYGYMDNVVEMWWDPNAADPEDGSTGAYRYPNDGRRYRLGEFTAEESRVFQEGIAGAQPDP